MIYFLLRKAEQLGLFEKVVHVKGSVRKDGSTVAPHMAVRHVKPEAPKTADLFEPAREPPPPLPLADVPVDTTSRDAAAADDREDLAAAMAKDPHSDETKGLIQKLADPLPAPRGDDLDPASPNYRFRDTGYVAGSRKEEAALIIRRMARKGERVHVTDIDWAQIEENPREAKDLIVKSNLFGAVDWDVIRASGMNPGAGFLLSRIYAAVGGAPAEDTPQGRRDYALAIDTLRARLEAAHTPAALISALEEMRDERDGAWLNEQEQRLYAGVSSVYATERAKYRELESAQSELHKRATDLNAQLGKHKYEAANRERRGWAARPELDALIAGMQGEADAAWQAAAAHRKDNGLEPIVHKENLPDGVSARFEYPARKDMERAQAAMETVRFAAKARNQAENPLTRAWNALGGGFNSVLNFRSSKGSESFGKHVATVKAGRVTDWSWAEKGDVPKGASKRSTTFQLHVADVVERVGGRHTTVASTQELKGAFNLREVQSGNWVLDDPNSAKFHVEACAGAFADLADMLGAPDEDISFRGRLAMAFGARGKGGAKAHYEPVHRVINITKMAGAGSLAHEWFHCIDNLVKEATSGIPSDVDDFATENPGTVDHPELSQAFKELTAAMTRGPHRKMAEMNYSEAEEAWARQNMSFGHGRVRSDIKLARGAQEASDAVDKHYAAGAFGPVEKRKSKNTRDNWRKIALIHHGGGEGRKVRYATGAGMSSFMLDALDLDQGDSGKYWSQPRELAARAFSSYMEDKLSAAGRKNTYLVVDANNSAYQGHRPFAEGAERQAMNAAFDRIFTLMRHNRVLAKAAELLGEAG